MNRSKPAAVRGLTLSPALSSPRCADWWGALALASLLLVSGCTDGGQPAEVARSLAQLCEEHHTDKCASHHDYVEQYELFFAPIREQAKRVLEIGVLHGASVRMWADYFPQAQVFGLDIKDTSQHDTERITTFVADQAEREQHASFLASHGGAFDLVIDDGGHTMRQQQVSFGFLFPSVSPGGYYIIEDIHTSFPDLYRGYGVEPDEQNSTFTMIVRFIRDRQFVSQYLDEYELQYLNRQVEYCLYSYRVNDHHSDFFICKKRAAAS